MTFRIQRVASGDEVVLLLSGEIAEGHDIDLRELLEAESLRPIVLDLAGLTVVDREGVLLLARHEAAGAVLMNCPGYVRAWIDREKEESRMPTTREIMAGEGTMTGPGGIRVFYRWWRPADAPRGVVTIIPGFKSHSGYYEWAAGQLTAAGIAVYAVDLRGRGKSDGDRFYVESFDDYLSDVDSVVNVARSREPTVPMFVLGHSAGGVLACLYALGHQHDLAGLLCESFAFQLPAPDVALAVLKGLSHLLPHAHVLHLKNEDFSRDRTVVDAMNADPLIADETQPTQTVAELVRAGERLKDAFPNITLPVLILHGTADKAAIAAGSEEFYDAAGAIDKTLRLYDGAFHDLLNDLDKNVVMADIIGWIERHLPTA